MEKCTSSSDGGARTGWIGTGPEPRDARETSANRTPRVSIPGQGSHIRPLERAALHRRARPRPPRAPPPLARRVPFAAPHRGIAIRLRRTGAYPTHLVFEPLVLLERLAALVPHPREHLLTYHGVLAPASPWRGLVVPAAARENESETVEPACAVPLDSHDPLPDTEPSQSSPLCTNPSPRPRSTPPEQESTTPPRDRSRTRGSRDEGFRPPRAGCCRGWRWER